LKVAQIDQVRLQFTVAEEDLSYISRGTEVEVTSEALERSLTGRITSLFHSVDQSSRTGLVEALVTNPGDQLLPGSYVVGEFTLRRESGVLWVPRSALIRYYQEPAVWVEAQRAGRAVAVRRPVEVGAEGRDRGEIREGLRAGDRVIASGHRDLVEGAPITPARSGEGTYRDLLLPQKPETTGDGGHQH
jgi:membrane fusion protein (multidrug efflux system)